MAVPHDLTEERNQRFLGLLQPVYGDCQRWAYNLAQNTTDAEDILAQSVLTGLKYIHQLKNDGAFKVWMFKIIANNYRLMLRSAKHIPEPIDPDNLRMEASHEELFAERTEMVRVLKQLLDQLAPEQHQALVLFEVHGLSIREVAQIMGKREPAVRVTLHRAKQRMAKLLEEAGLAPGARAMELERAKR
jgi:RNA polymerase sigma-70 factor, ECF subfamily